MLVTAVEARPLRSLDDVRMEPAPGITSLVGPNGVGKTNLLEALYFGLTGRSFRTSDRRDLIPFGASLARAEVVVSDEDGTRAAAARLGQPRGGAPPPARRQSGRSRRRSPATARRSRSSRPTG